MSIIERRLEQAFLRILNKHGNPQWAREELDWKVFVKNADKFHKLSDSDQWIVRNYMDGLKKVHGGK